MTNKPTYEDLEQRVRELEAKLSRRNRVMEEVRQNEERYRLLFNSGNDAVFVYQPTPNGLPGRFIEVNDVACRMYGYTRKELLNLTPIKLSPLDRVDDVKARVQKLSAHRNILFETVHVTKEGKKIPVEIHSQMFELDGQPTVISIVRDITRREHAETALRESEAQKRAILDASIDRIRYVGRDMRIIWANKTTAMALGMSPEELAGEVCYKLLVGRDTPCEGCPTVRAQETGKIERAVMSHTKVKGVVGESYWDNYCVPLKNETGEIVSFIQIARNITDQKRAEEHIHTLTQQLMKVQESERQMISRELHDRLGQDLSTLKIGCDTLFDKQPDIPPKIRQKVSELSKLLQRCIMAVRDLAYDLRPPSLDQLGLVQTIFRYCEDLSEKTGLSVDFTSAGMDDLNLDFDTEINLYRLIQEGLINISKHADASHVTVRLVTSFPTIILRIEDDGKGFDVRNRLFAAMNEKRMGLRSMEERASLLGGKMKIESRPGKGTGIIIEVPLKKRK